MSSSSVAVRVPGGGLAAAEVRLVLRRRRNLVMLGLLAAVPVVVGLVLRLAGAPEPGGQGGPPGFLTQVTENGLFLGFSALVVVTPFLLPLTMSVVAGEAIAGETAQGTLRYLLAVPAGRGRVLGVKYLALATYGLVASLVVSAVGLLVGAALFPVGRVTLLSGTSIGLAETLWRALLIALYGTVLMAGVAAIGLFVSTLTEVPLAAMAATAAVPVVAQILGAFPDLAPIHPWLFTDAWLAYGDLLRDPIDWSDLSRGAFTQAGYVAVFGSLAWARLTTKDVTS